jgi:hypothetical protein
MRRPSVLRILLPVQPLPNLGPLPKLVAHSSVIINGNSQGARATRGRQYGREWHGLLCLLKTSSINPHHLPAQESEKVMLPLRGGEEQRRTPQNDSDQLIGCGAVGSPERTPIRDLLAGIEIHQAKQWTLHPKLCAREDSGASCIATRQESNHFNRLIAEMLPCVRCVAAKIPRKLSPHIESDDLVGAGCPGPLSAFCRFNTKRHVRFVTYVRNYIQGAILDEMRKMDYTPRDIQRQSKQVGQAHRNLELRFGRAVKESEREQQLSVAMEEWHQQRESRTRNLDRFECKPILTMLSIANSANPHPCLRNPP